jgi:hypothetical protein
MDLDQLINGSGSTDKWIWNNGPGKIGMEKLIWNNGPGKIGMEKLIWNNASGSINQWIWNNEVSTTSNDLVE